MQNWLCDAHDTAPGATNACHCAALPDALWPAGIWLVYDTEAFNGKGCEAALFPLGWVLITLCPALKSSLLSQRPSLAEARQVRLQNDLQPVYGRSLVTYKTWKLSGRC